MFLFLLQGSCAADLYRHPQLDADIEAVKDIYTDSAVSVRYSTRAHITLFKIRFKTKWKGFCNKQSKCWFDVLAWLEYNVCSLKKYFPSSRDYQLMGLEYNASH